jgi:DNA helicase-2/ATP-dependent DNA helicase PcrA
MEGRSMTEALAVRLQELSPIQRAAVAWSDGAALVLAGPGAGKTGVLTCRIARLLNDSAPRKFKVLALTFTTKAAKEMSTRVEALVPDQMERTYIGTFHAFCASVLRQHGSHIGIKPDFGIYDQDSDRKELLLEAARASGLNDPAVGDFIQTIDRLKQNLLTPERTAARYTDAAVGARVAHIYGLYEGALRRENLMDFNGLILETCRLVATVPAVANRLRQTYPYWLIDEFQDTSPAQYRMLRAWAGDTFRNVFAVADDDQIIYQWAGASYRQLERFREHFQPELVQLVENHRCPPIVVEAANKLVARNTQRTPDKRPLVAARQADATIEVRHFDDDAAEAQAIAEAVLALNESEWPSTAVIARSRAQLTLLAERLRACNVKAVIAERRGRFVSPQFAWLQAALDQALRPGDRRVSKFLIEAAERILQIGLEPEVIVEESEALGVTILERLGDILQGVETSPAQAMATFIKLLVNAREKWRTHLPAMISALMDASKVDSVVPPDVEDDAAAWKAAEIEIRQEKGSDPELAEFVQGMALRSKTPPPDLQAVSLLTVHASKGLEFDHVFVVGLAESVFPSFQSVQKGPASAEIEEERRNCFVAVTRTRQTLVLSYATQYRGWRKERSRFLNEMELPD